MHGSRAKIVIAVLLLLAALVPLTGEGEYRSEWWDISRCDVCRNFAAYDGLMEAMEWEEYTITTGSVSILRVGREHLSALRAALSGVEEQEEAAARGGVVETCGMCTAVRDVVRKGAELEHIQTPDGEITLLTSDDPAVVVEIHAILERNEAEMEKLASFAKK